MTMSYVDCSALLMLEKVLQIVVSTSLVPEILTRVHGDPSAGYYGHAKMLTRTRQLFYWPYMATDISKHCAQCAAYQSRHSLVPRPQAPLMPISPDHPFEIVAVDITDLPPSTNPEHTIRPPPTPCYAGDPQAFHWATVAMYALSKLTFGAIGPFTRCFNGQC